MKHPIQSIEIDAQGVSRFKKNEIVRFLLDKGYFDLNAIAIMPFSDDDRMQFAQLIGYSVSGFSELDYVDNDTYSVALEMADSEKSEAEVRANYFEGQLNNVRQLMKPMVTSLFTIHEDDLHS